MLNARLVNPIPNSRRSNDVLNSRVSSFQTGHSGESYNISAGMPIGLLLVLTYSENQFSPPFYDGIRPTTRIVTM